MTQMEVRRRIIWSELKASLGLDSWKEEFWSAADRCLEHKQKSPWAGATGGHSLHSQRDWKVSRWSLLLGTCTGLPQGQSWVRLFQRETSHRRVQQLSDEGEKIEWQLVLPVQCAFTLRLYLPSLEARHLLPWKIQMHQASSEYSLFCDS